MLELRRAHTGRICVIGHRGAEGYAAENTMPAFELGLKQGAHILELDVHLSRDGEVVVIHDATLERTTNGHGYVRDYTLAELKQLDAGSKFSSAYAGARLPTLIEVLEWAQGRVDLAIEIKAAHIRYAGIEAQVVDLVRRYQLIDHVAITSFDHHCVHEVKRLEPNIATILLYLARPVDPVGMMRAAQADVMRPYWAYVTAAEVQVARDHGWAIVPYGATQRSMWEYLWALCVDGMSANHPDQLVATLVELEGRHTSAQSEDA